VARALIVGCGCRGRRLGAGLRDAGWLVRGTTRRQEELAEIEAAGLEPALADPDLIGEVLELVADVTLVFWLMGTAAGDPVPVADLHGARLERLLEELVDTPVRGIVYEGAGRAPLQVFARGRQVVEAAARVWRIPAEVVTVDPGDHDDWRTEMLAAANRLISAG
jgi:hypothetical protein